MATRIGKRVAALTVAAATAMSVAACGTSTGSGAGGDTGTATELKVGVITISSGPYAAISKESIDAANITADQLNAEQHKYKISIVEIGTDGTPNNTLQAVTGAIQQKGVKYVSGFFTSSTALVIQAQVKRLGAVALAAVNQSADLVGAGCNSNYFQVSTVDSQYTMGAKDIVKASGVTTWDTVAEDYAAGRDKVKQFDSVVKETNGTMRVSVYPALGATDFGTQISQLGDNAAQGLFVGILGADAATFAKQAAQFGLFEKYKFIIGSGYLQAALLPALGDAVVGTHEVLNYSPEAATASPFGKVYATKNDGPLWHVPIEGHLALVLLAAAADKAGSGDPSKVATALGGLTVPNTIVGNVTMRAEDHLLLQDLFPAVAEPGPTLTVKSTIPAVEATPPVNPACKM